MKAFFDNEIEEPKLQPGQCRLIKKDLDFSSNFPEDFVFSLLELTDKYYYFHWMLPNLDDLPTFKKKYQNISQSVYPKLKKLIQKYIDKSERERSY